MRSFRGCKLNDCDSRLGIANKENEKLCDLSQLEETTEPSLDGWMLEGLSLLMKLTCWRWKEHGEYDLIGRAGGAWDAPDFRLGSYGGEGLKHAKHLASESHNVERKSKHRQYVTRISRQTFTLHCYPGQFPRST